MMWQAKQHSIKILFRPTAPRLRVSAVLLYMKLMTFFDVQKVASGKSGNFKYSIRVHLLYGYRTPCSINDHTLVIGHQN